MSIENKVPMSDFDRLTEVKDSAEIIALQDNDNARLPLQSIIAKIIEVLNARFIHNSEINKPYGVAGLNGNGKVPLERIEGIEIDTNLIPIDLFTPAPTRNGVFVPTEAGVYANFGNLEVTDDELENSLVYFYYIGGVFTKQVKASTSVDKVEPNNANAVSSQAVYNYAIQNVNTIEDLRNLEGKIDQKINLLGYYNAGDKPSLIYEWIDDNTGVEDDGGSSIVVSSGYWRAVVLNYIDLKDFGVLENQDITNTLNYVLLNNRKVKISGKYKVKSSVKDIINIQSNSVLFFEIGSEIELITSNKNRYNIFNAFQIEKAIIINPKIIGDVDFNTETTGEWGHGISVIGCKDVDIINPNITKCFGDGLYFGSSESDTYKNENVNVYGGECSYNRRNNITITTLNGIIDETLVSYAGNPKYTPPGAGIDIEPNNLGYDEIDVILSNIKSISNLRAGIQLTPTFMTSDNYINRKYNVIIDNFKSINDGSLGGIRYANTDLNNENINILNKINGYINILNPTIISSERNAVRIDRHYDNGLSIYMSNVLIDGCVSEYTDSLINNSALLISAENSQTSLGHIEINGINIRDNKSISNIKTPIFYNNQTNLQNRNLLINDLVVSAIFRDVDNGYFIMDNNNLSQINTKNKKTFNINSDASIKGNLANNNIFNINENCTIDLLNNYNNTEYELRFFNVNCIIRPHVGGRLNYENLNTGEPIYVNGGYVSIKVRLRGNNWYIENISGFDFYENRDTRPTTNIIGYTFFDKTINKPIWYIGGNKWVDSQGIEV